MDDREVARGIIAQITADDIWAQLWVSSGVLHVKSASLSSELSEQIKAGKQMIIDYLTTPPDVTGICNQGHKIEWMCTARGIWVCNCYVYVHKRKKHSVIKDYWTREVS